MDHIGGQPGRGVSNFKCRGTELTQWLESLAVLAEKWSLAPAPKW